jgi:hypothetical protein
MDQVLEKSHEKGKHEHTIEITVNERPVLLKDKNTTGLGIKKAAIAQGVPIKEEFILQQELPNGSSRIIGDNDPVKVHPHDRFTAIDRDDNS